MTKSPESIAGSTNPSEAALQRRERLKAVLRLIADPSGQGRAAAIGIVQELLGDEQASKMPSPGDSLFSYASPDLISGDAKRYDKDLPEAECFPQLMHAEFLRCGKTVCLVINGQHIGDELADKAAVEDGYRFHDAFHLAHAAVLGWSPVLRALLRRRRRSRPDTDENEDGGRAQMIEEAVSHVIFVHGRDGNEVFNPDRIDRAFITHLRRLTCGLEVEERGPHEWAQAIAEGWKAFNALRIGRCSALLADLNQGQLRLSHRINQEAP